MAPLFSRRRGGGAARVGLGVSNKGAFLISLARRVVDVACRWREGGGRVPSFSRGVRAQRPSAALASPERLSERYRACPGAGTLLTPTADSASKHPSMCHLVDALRGGQNTARPELHAQEGLEITAYVDCKRTRNVGTQLDQPLQQRPLPVYTPNASHDTRRDNRSQQRQNNAHPPPRAAPPPGAQPSGSAAAADAATKPDEAPQQRVAREPQSRGRRDREEPRPAAGRRAR